MNLDDKTLQAMSAPDLAGQAPETVPTKNAKRRKSNGGNGGSARKAKKPVVEVDESIDDSAPLTMGSSAGGARQRKKMLFEAQEADAPPSIALMGGNGHAPVDPSIFTAAEAAAQQKPAPIVAMPMAAEVKKPVEQIKPVIAPVVEGKPATPAPVEATPAAPAVAAAEPAAPIADMKGSVFQVATLVMRSSETPEAQAAPAVAQQPEKAAPADQNQGTAPVPSAPVTPVAALAESMVEKAAAAAQPVAPKPEAVEPVPAAPIAAPAIAPTPAARVEDVLPTSTTQAEAPAAEKAPAVLSRSQAIAARAARMSAQSSARPAVQPQQPVASAARAPEPQRPAEPPAQAGDIYGYWTRVKNGRRFPSRSDFDAEQLAEHWPNSMLLTCAKTSGNVPVTFSSVLRLGANRRSRPGEDLSITSMITEWILSTGGEAARAGKPVQDTEVFPTPEGTHAYKIVALPLSDHQMHVDHVLCHLSRS